jgi:magnesium transporter
MSAHSVVYREGRRVASGDLSSREVATADVGDGFVWVELSEPSKATMEELRSRFDLPELAVEDAHHAHQRPKLEEYEDSLFAVVRTVAYDAEQERADLGEVHLFVGDDYVIVVRHRGGEAELSEARKRAERHSDLLRLGPVAVLYAVMDAVVDSYVPVMEDLDADIEEVEVEVEAGLRQTTLRIYNLKRQVLQLYRASGPLEEPLERLQRGDLLPIPEDARQYFRDVYDHIRRANDRVEGQRELLTSVLDTNVALVTIRQNDIVRKVSGWAAIIAVPTLITGIYGMNFEHMPELRWELGYPLALLVMAAIAGGLYALLKRVGWL